MSGFATHGQKTMPAKAPVAAAVGVKPENVFANSILFDEAGLYAGFDAEEFTSRAGGKAEAIRYLKARDGFQTLVMWGTGPLTWRRAKMGARTSSSALGGWLRGRPLSLGLTGS